MSLDTKAKTQLKQLKTGIHLVTITDAWLTKNPDGTITKYPSGEQGLTIRFTNGKNFSFDNNFYLKGDREWIFKQMCTAGRIDASKPAFKAEAIGKRLWIAIKEVHDVDGENYICDDITGMPVINYYIFKYFQYFDQQTKPGYLGEPTEKNKFEASGDFLDYRQIGPIDKLSKEQRVATAKAIIGDTAPKSKAMIPNEEFSMEKGKIEPMMEIAEKNVIDDDFMSEDNVIVQKVDPITNPKVLEKIHSKNELADEEIDWDL